MTLRPVTLPESRPVGEPPVQLLPELAWVAVADLRIDDSYQRPLERSNWKIIQKIADAFDWTCFSPLIVAPLPEGGFAVIDGQHRAHAAALRGIDRVPALVAALPRAAQARAFSAVNGQITRLSLFHLYRAALEAGERWAVECRQVVEAAGCTLVTSNASTERKKPRQVYAIALIRDHVLVGRGDLVLRGLAVLAGDARTGVTPAAWAERLLRPWLATVAAFPELSEADLARFAAEADPLRVVRSAPRLAERAEFRGTPVSRIATESLSALLRNYIATGAVWPGSERAA
jgi:hypothetical protein